MQGQSGLGLSICQVWIEKLGGQLKVESHKGACTFELIFPHKQKSSDKTQKAYEPTIESKKRQVAVIEDIPSLRRNTCAEIEKSGFSTVSLQGLMDSLIPLKESSHFSVIVVDRHLKMALMQFAIVSLTLVITSTTQVKSFFIQVTVLQQITKIPIKILIWSTQGGVC